MIRQTMDMFASAINEIANGPKTTSFQSMNRQAYRAAKVETGINRFFRKDFDAAHTPVAAFAIRRFHAALNHLWSLRGAGVDKAVIRWWLTYAMSHRKAAA